MITLPRFAFVFLATLTLLLATSASMAAREVIITLKDGRTVRGEVVEETDKAVTLLIAKIRTPYERELIKSIEFVKTVEEEYAERREKIADDNIAERHVLARWLFDKKAYAMAKKELDDLIVRDPKNSDIALLKTVVDGRIKDTGGARVGPDGPVTPNPANTPPAGDLPKDKDRLDLKQINRLRVYEFDEKATPTPRVTIPPPILDKFLTEYTNEENVPKAAAARNKFKAQKGIEQLKLMMQVGAKEFYGDVVIHDDPPVIREFRNTVHRNYVISYCATNDCHGGSKGGKFFLFNTAPTASETVHSNLYILSQASTKTAYMVDRDYPNRSLLVHFGMPRDKTNSPHPDVPGWKPHMLTGEKDPMYQTTVNWVKMLYRPTPKYELNYKIPTIAPILPDKKETPKPPAKEPVKEPVKDPVKTP